MIFLIPWNSLSIGSELLEWGRFKISPSISANRIFSDNIFLAETNEKEDYLTKISGELSCYLALTPESHIGLGYTGFHEFSEKYDNYNNDQHLGELSWSHKMPSGSRFALGSNVLSRSIQPYWEEDEAKDYIKKATFANMVLNIGEVTELGFKYTYTTRRFDQDIYKNDNYNNHGFRTNAAWKFFPLLSLLVEYRYSVQDRPDYTGTLSPEIKWHEGYIGGRWDPGSKLNGELKIGYMQTDYEEGEDFGDVAVDTNLSYRLSEIITLGLSIDRKITGSARAERETGDYYIDTTSRISLTYMYFENIRPLMFYSYRNDDYMNASRNDDKQRAGIEIRGHIKKWLSISAGYQYRKNDSNLPTVNYEENRLNAEISLTL